MIIYATCRVDVDFWKHLLLSRTICLLMKNLGTSELTCTALRLLMLSDTSFIGRVDHMAED